MPNLNLSIEIAAKPESVFACFERTELMHRWIEGLHDFRYESSGPVSVGSRFLQRNKMGGKLVTYKGEITSYEQARKFGAKIDGDDYEYQMDFTVVPLAGKSRLDYAGGLTFTTPLARFFGPVITFFSRRVFERELKNIKTVSELI